MPQMSSLDWLILMMYFIFIYFLLLIMINFLMYLNLYIKKIEIKNKFIYNLIWD